jgi:hypothetical protein
MVTLLSESERRAVARFVIGVWRNEWKRRRRRPVPHETIIAAYCEARHTVDRFVGNRFNFLGGPRSARCNLGQMVGGSSGETVPAAEADVAELVIRYFNEGGDLASAKPQSTIVDRRIMELMAAAWHRDHEVNDSDVGRTIGLSHTSVRDRRLARSARIMAALHENCPDLWGSNGHPAHDFEITAAAA